MNFTKVDGLMLPRINRYLILIFISTLGMIYFFTAPFTVQIGDTGELVTNSFFLRVSHPPGYPLWTLLYSIPLNLYKNSTPFRVASLTTISLSLVSLFLILKRFRQEFDWAIIGVFFTSSVVWKYSILPDVFSLHIMFIVWCYLIFDKPEMLDDWKTIFLMALSIAHHHTIIFLCPLYFFSLYQNFSHKKMLYSLFFGILGLSLYGFLLFFHPHENGSWGNLENLKDVIQHFLRTDYGTFRLTKKSISGDSWWLFELQYLINDFWSLVIVSCYFLFKKNNLKSVLTLKNICIAASIIFYIMTFSFLAPFSLVRDGESVFERFLIQPSLGFIFLILGIKKNERGPFPKILGLLIIANLGVNILKNYERVDLSQNTIVEDYTLNMVSELPQSSFLMIKGDSLNFSTYYILSFLTQREDLIHYFFMNKKKVGSPPFFLEYEKTLTKNGPSFENFNFNHYPFFTNLKEFKHQSFKKVYDGLIVKVKPRSEKDSVANFSAFHCLDHFKRRFIPDSSQYSHFKLSYVYDLKYGDCYLYKALDEIKNKKYSEAKGSLKKAIQLSPMNVRYLENLCKLLRLTNDRNQSHCEKTYRERSFQLHSKYLEFI